MKYDYIIVGQGIAGSVLAFMLLQKGKKVLVVDEPSLSKSSRIAAGLYNPIVFKRLVKSWKADELIHFADQFYTQAENGLNTRFYYKKNIVKIFTEQQEVDLWKKKLNEEEKKYLSKEIKEGESINFVYSGIGYSEVMGSGYLDMKVFTEETLNYFKKNNCYLNEKIEYNAIKFSEQQVEYKNFKASKIIFCEGYKALENPYWSWLPFKLTKGEILTVKIKKIDLKTVINKGVFVLPIGDDLYKVGATYEWNDLDPNTTEKGKQELIDKLKKVIATEFEIISHNAGIRPTVIDRRPIVGLHPNNSQIGIFNGMGTKGVMIAPFFANQLIDRIEKKTTIDAEVDVKRFETRYLPISQSPTPH